MNCSIKQNISYIDIWQSSEPKRSMSFKISAPNRKNEYAGCVAYMQGQIWSYSFESFIIIRCKVSL